MRPGGWPCGRRGRLDNFGIRRVERLDGNVGYLDLRRVAVPANAGPAIAAAMELVAGTYALIIDLRHNGGGSPEGVVLWCSYLLTEKPTHLNDIFHADTGETRQFWALPYVPGTRYVDRPVYVLTSSHTFSGGEDFCYTLQALGRAELIGETTGGGAHPTRGFPISPRRAHRHPVRAVDQPGDRHELGGHRRGPGRRRARGAGLRRRVRQGAPARAGRGRRAAAHRGPGPRRARRAATGLAPARSRAPARHPGPCTPSSRRLNHPGRVRR